MLYGRRITRYINSWRLCIIITCVFCMLGLFACSGKSSGNRTDEMILSPYEYTDDEEQVLNFLGLKNDVDIVEVQVPSLVKSITVSAYALDDKNQWVLKRNGRMEFDQGHELLKGNIAMHLKNTMSPKFIMNFEGNAIYQFESGLPSKTALNSYYTVLSQEIIVDSQEEIPIAILGYTNDTSFEVLDLEDFSAKEQLSSFDYVYALTVQFLRY